MVEGAVSLDCAGFQSATKYAYDELLARLAPRVALEEKGPTWLLIGGTASVRGEESAYLEDLPAQGLAEI